MNIRCVWEHNGNDSLIYAENCPGAYARGASREEALAKMEREITSWLCWQGMLPQSAYELEIAQEKNSDLEIRDADSDVLFDAETGPMELAEYERMKALALRSAADFLRLYESIADQDRSCLSQRRTFYGPVPRTAREMYEHTKNVNAYYFGEIDVEVDNAGDILACRERGFAALEQQPRFLENRVIDGSYGEQWTVKKVLRRFLWHGFCGKCISF